MKERKRKAKMDVLEKIREMLKEMDLEDFKHSMKKVTVAAENDKGLLEGLDKAKEIIKKKKLVE